LNIDLRVGARDSRLVRVLLFVGVAPRRNRVVGMS
jgi:hypothetical protein